MLKKIPQSWWIDLILTLLLFVYSSFLLVTQPPDAVRFPSLPLSGCWALFFFIQFVYYVWSNGPIGVALSQKAVQCSLIPLFIAAVVYVISLVVQNYCPQLWLFSVHALPCAVFALRELFLLFSALFHENRPKLPV